MWYIILYILFFIAQLLYGSWHVLGPLTPRHIMTIVMFVICIRERAFVRDKYMSLHYVFVFFFLLVGIVGGYMSDTMSKFIAYYFVSIVAFYSTLLFLDKYNGVYYFVITLIVLGILNSIVTIGNMFMMPWATRITDFLHVTNSMDLLDYVNTRRGTISMEGFTVPGLISDVGNGYFMAYLSILSLYSKDRQIHIYNIAIYALFIITLFFIQERTGFVAGFVLSLYALYRILGQKAEGSSNKRLLMFCVISVSMIIMLPKAYDYMISGSSRYADLGFDYAEGRSRLNEASIDFLLGNPLGGFYDFFHQYHVYPHSLFYNALIYGGIIGGVSLFIMLFKQIVLIIKIVIHRISFLNYDLYFFSLMFIAYNLCSITHNQSVATGDPTFWVLWALCLNAWNKQNIIF